MPKCICLTKEGHRCKNQVAKEGERCHVHAGLECKAQGMDKLPDAIIASLIGPSLDIKDQVTLGLVSNRFQTIERQEEEKCNIKGKKEVLRCLNPDLPKRCLLPCAREWSRQVMSALERWVDKARRKNLKRDLPSAMGIYVTDILDLELDIPPGRLTIEFGDRCPKAFQEKYGHLDRVTFDELSEIDDLPSFFLELYLKKQQKDWSWDVTGGSTMARLFGQEKKP